MKIRALKNLLNIIILSVLLTAVAAGFAVMARYENTPGDDGNPRPDWPAESALPHDQNLPTLIVAAHPECPCTHASLGELEKLVAQAPGQFTAIVLFVQPEGFDPQDTEAGDLWQQAAAIPGVHLFRDAAGREARRFQVATSGHALLFSPRGKLLFSGGITGSRGHLGQNAGATAVLALLRHEKPASDHTRIFGCSLLGSNP